MNEISLDVISADDFDELYRIEKRAYPIPWSEKTMRSMVDGDGYKIKVVSCDKIIAYIFVLIVLDEATILNITVDPDLQGKGLGRQLLQSVKADLIKKNITSIFLEVRQSNLNAVSLYETEGFNEIDIRKNYYPTVNGREDAIIMACPLIAW